MLEFEEIYQKYLKEVYLFLLKLSRNEHIAEELTQETFVKAYENMSKFRGECKVSVWLCQIAKNTYFGHYNKNKKIVSDELLNQQVSLVDMEKDIIAFEEKYTVHRILHVLKEPYKEVFSMKIFGELSYKEISQIFEKSESWARVTYYRAKCMIQDKLKEVEPW